MTQIYLTPSELWDYCAQNKDTLRDRPEIVARNEDTEILLAVNYAGTLKLTVDSFDEEVSQLVETEQEARDVYVEYLNTYLGEAGDMEGNFSTYYDNVIRAAYAFVGVLIGKPPDEEAITRDDLEQVAGVVAEFLREYGVESDFQ